MGLCNSPDIFQEEMGTLMQDLSHVRTYIDDLLVITKSTFESHLHKLDEVLSHLDQAGLKINAKNPSLPNKPWNIWVFGLPDKAFNLCQIKFKQCKTLHLQPTNANYDDLLDSLIIIETCGSGDLMS